MILLSRREQRETTDGDFHKAVWQPARFCIPLLRPHCHQRLPQRVIPARAGGSFCSRGPRHSGGEQGSSQPANRRLPELGGSVCPQPQDSDRVGGKRCSQGKVCAARVRPDGEEECLWRLLHLQEHGTGTDVPDQRAEVSHAGSQLPHPGTSDEPLHPLLLLHSRRSPGADHRSRGIGSSPSMRRTG